MTAVSPAADDAPPADGRAGAEPPPPRAVVWGPEAGTAAGPPLDFTMGVSFELDGLAETARLIESLDFDGIGCGEHVMFHGPTPNAFVVLSHIAAVTTRVRLLTAIALAPLYPAPLLAKLGAMLDVVSGGRLDFGVGVGGEFPAEFEACGVPISERGARTDEALELLTALWSGESVTFEGRFTNVRDGRIDPPPLQRPHPPIWVAGRAVAALRRAARFGDVWMPYMYTPERFADSVATLRELSVEAGRDPDAVRSCVNCFITVDPDAGAARRTAERCLADTYRQDFSGHRGRYLIAGSAETCVERLSEYVEAGASGAVFSVAAAPGDARRMIQLVGEEVVPALRARQETIQTVGRSTRMPNRAD